MRRLCFEGRSLNSMEELRGFGEKLPSLEKFSDLSERTWKGTSLLWCSDLSFSCMRSFVLHLSLGWCAVPETAISARASVGISIE